MASIAMLLGVSSSSADLVAFSNYNPADDSTLSGLSLFFLPSSTGQKAGFTFTAERGGTLSAIDAAIFSSFQPYEATVRVYADDSGLPGLELGAFVDLVETNDPFHVAPMNSIEFDAGSTYHIVLDHPTDVMVPSLQWRMALESPDLQQVSQSEFGGAWDSNPTLFNTGAFQILITPAPASIAMVGFGIAAVTRRRRLTPA